MAQHLLHVGYPKAGSTFLQKWFEHHPELKFKNGGMGGFSSVFEAARPLDTRYKYFVTSSEALSMPHESTGNARLLYSGQVKWDLHEPFKENQAQVCDVLKALYPGSRVLIVTRGFEGMIFSGYSQSLRVGSVYTLEQMCEQIAVRIKEAGQHYYDYDYFIDIYARAFGEDNLIVLPYELLRDDQNRFLGVLEEKLGLEHVEMARTRVNASLSPEELYWYPLISQKVANLSGRLGSRAFRKLYAWYIQGTLNNKFRAPIKVLQRVNPKRRVTKSDVPREILEQCRGKATRLKDAPFYAPYAADYLWD